jgi:hypothetical protein
MNINLIMILFIILVQCWVFYIAIQQYRKKLCARCAYPIIVGGKRSYHRLTSPGGNVVFACGRHCARRMMKGGCEELPK